MNHGIVGGTLRSQRAQIEALAGLAVRVLRGEPADSIPLTELKLGENEVDWRQLQRWHISEADVPPGTRILFRDADLWHEYKAQIIGATALLVVQAALIAFLLVQRAKRKQALQQAAKSHAEAVASYEQVRNLGVRLLNAQEVERSRIARDLHDDVTQALSLLVCDLRLAGSSNDPPKAIQEIVDKAQDITTSVRNLSHQLHPAHLRIAGLVASLTACNASTPGLDSRYPFRTVVCPRTCRKPSLYRYIEWPRKACRMQSSMALPATFPSS
jgi:signal transduction histidine kinase